MTIELENGPPPEWMVALENKKRVSTSILCFKFLLLTYISDFLFLFLES